MMSKFYSPVGQISLYSLVSSLTMKFVLATICKQVIVTLVASNCSSTAPTPFNLKSKSITIEVIVTHALLHYSS